MYNSATQRYSEIDLTSIDGRMGKMHYFFYSTAIPFILFWVFTNLASIIVKLGSTSVASALLGLAITASVIWLVSITIQRCHDFNANSWIAVLAVIPFANLIFSLIPGDSGLNSYGEPSKPNSLMLTISVGFLAVLLLALIASYLYAQKLL